MINPSNTINKEFAREIRFALKLAEKNIAKLDDKITKNENF